MRETILTESTREVGSRREKPNSNPLHIIARPKLHRTITSARCNEPRIIGNIRSQNRAVMAREALAHSPVVCGENIDRLVEPSTHHESAGLLRLHGTLVVTVDGVSGTRPVRAREPFQVCDAATVRTDGGSLPYGAQVPALGEAVCRACEHPVAVGAPVEGVDGRDVGIEEHDCAAGAQVPDAAD